MSILAELLPTSYRIEDLISVLFGLAAFASVLLVWFALLQPSPMKSRLKSLERRRDELQRAQLAPQRHQMRRRGISIAGDVVRRLRLLQTAQTKRIGDQLAQAGWRGKDAIVLYLFAKAVLPVAFAIMALLLLYAFHIGTIGPLVRIAITIAAVIAGAYAPDIFVTNTSQKRRKKIQKAMPDGLDLMVICAEAGLSLDATLSRVSRELRGSWPELADELALTGIELGFMPERKRALDNLTRRVQLPGIKALVNTLYQTERYGTPLAQALRVLSAELRTHRLTVAEEKAARLPAIMTVPMIIFILPTLFVVLLGPGILRVIDGLSGAMS
ncbi:MAG: type II secretion system F family protein [Alphaproteobacteria bacterium]